MNKIPLTRRRPGGNTNNLRVLQISDDQNLAITRLLLLQSHGYIGEHLFSSHVPSATYLKGFQIFLICQSIEPQKSANIIARIRAEVPAARILRVRTISGDKELGADLSLNPPAGPWDLVRALESLATLRAADHTQQG